MRAGHGRQRSRGGRWLGVVVAMVVTSACAGRKDPNVIMPAKTKPAAPDPRQHGRGDMELVVGSLTVGVAATMTVFGSVMAARAASLRAFCDSTTYHPNRIERCFDALMLRMDTGLAISSGLSFAMAVPVAAAGGLLLRRGIRLRRAAGPKMQVQPTFSGTGGGLTLQVQF